MLAHTSTQVTMTHGKSQIGYLANYINLNARLRTIARVLCIMCGLMFYCMNRFDWCDCGIVFVKRAS